MRAPVMGLIVGLLVACSVGTPVLASDESDVMAVVKAYLADMNNGDVANFTKRCAPQAIILDDFPPHVWQGATACTDWLNALIAYDEKTGVSPIGLTIGEPRRISIDGDHAYVVLPAGYQYKEKGKMINETGSVWTVALQKMADGWRVTGWAWAQG